MQQIEALLKEELKQRAMLPPVLSGVDAATAAAGVASLSRVSLWQGAARSVAGNRIQCDIGLLPGPADTSLHWHHHPTPPDRACVALAIKSLCSLILIYFCVISLDLSRSSFFLLFLLPGDRQARVGAACFGVQIAWGTGL